VNDEKRKGIFLELGKKYINKDKKKKEKKFKSNRFQKSEVAAAIGFKGFSLRAVCAPSILLHMVELEPRQGPLAVDLLEPDPGPELMEEGLGEGGEVHSPIRAEVHRELPEIVLELAPFHFEGKVELVSHLLCDVVGVLRDLDLLLAMVLYLFLGREAKDMWQWPWQLWVAAAEGVKDMHDLPHIDATVCFGDYVHPYVAA